MRSKYVPAATGAVTAAGRAVAHEFTSKDSYLRNPLAASTIDGVGTSVASGVALTGHVVRITLVGSAEITGRGIGIAGKALGHVLGKRPPVAVTSATRAHIARAKLVTRTGVVVTGAAVSGAAAMAKNLGAAVSSTFMSTSVGRSMAHTGTNTGAGRAACKIARASVGVVNEVWCGLEDAARTLGRHTASAATEFAGERYGEDARDATAQALSVGADVGEAALALRRLNPVVLLGQTANEATRDFVDHAPIVAASSVNAGGAAAATTPALTDVPLSPLPTPDAPVATTAAATAGASSPD